MLSTYFRKLKEIGVVRPIFPDYVISCDYGYKYQLRLWSGKYSILWTRPTGRKNLELTLNDISSRNEVRASHYLILKSNKITAEEEQQDRQTWKTLF